MCGHLHMIGFFDVLMTAERKTAVEANWQAFKVGACNLARVIIAPINACNYSEQRREIVAINKRFDAGACVAAAAFLCCARFDKRRSYSARLRIL